jgi:hypothetical protein
MKWNSLDELQDEFVYRDENINGYVWRGKDINGRIGWHWYVSRENKLAYRGTEQFTVDAFEAAEKIIEELQN